MSIEVLPVGRLSLDKPTFADFYAAHWSTLANFAHSITRDRAAAADIAQETMARAYARWVLVREPLPWAFRVARNLAIDSIRRLQRERAAAAELAGPGDYLMHDGALLEEVLRLPKSLRDAVLLHYLADLTVTDTAIVLKRSPGTVKRHLHEARTELARRLEKEDDL